MTRPSVCMVSNLYGRLARGGAERIVAMEAEGLAARGSAVSVVCGAAVPRAPSRENGVEVREVRPPNLFFYAELGRHGAAARLAWHAIDTVNVLAARRALRAIAAQGPDVVHTHNLMGLGFALPRMLRRRGIRHVHTVHDVQLLHPSGLLPSGYAGPRNAAERAYVAAMRRVMGSPEAVIFPSEALMELHERLGFFRGSRRVVLGNPAPRPDDRPREAPERTGFVFIGQLEPHKGITALLDAWASWEDRGEATLEVAGDGSLAAEVAARVQDLPGATFLGKLSKGEVLRALGRASYVVVPSTVIENSPTVLLEAMSRGTPAVASATGGIPELVTHATTGFLFAPGDDAAISAALRRASSASDWAALSAAARAAAAERGLNGHLDALESVYAGKD